jgi:hypothetical protein
MSICLATAANIPLPTSGKVRVNNNTIEAEAIGGDIVWLPKEWRTYWRILWQVADDIYDGLHDYLVRSLYLIQKPGEPDAAYTLRLIASSLDNYYRDAIDYYAGLLSQFEPTEGVPDELLSLFDNVDGAGNSLQVLLMQADKEILRKDACLIFVDPVVEDSVNKVPRLRVISLNEIYSPIVEQRGDRYVITQLCIHRKVQRRDGVYAIKDVDQYWMYIPGEVIIFEHTKADGARGKESLVEVERKNLLTASGAPLMEVPAIWYSCGGGTPLCPETPPFHRLLEISLKQMNKVSELDDAEGKVNTITPYRMWPDDKPSPLPPLRLGANAVADIEQCRDGAKIGMLEATGNAIALTHERNQDRAEQMKELSRAFIGGRSTLTATEANQNDSRSKVNLKLVANQKESTTQEVFKLMMTFIDPNFRSADFKDGIAISDEALRAPVTAQDIKIVQDGYINGSYSQRYMLLKLKDIGFQPDGIDIDEELNTVQEVAL